MFERFTDRARRVIVLAQEEARALQHNYIGTEHLLLGLIRRQIIELILAKLRFALHQHPAQTTQRYFFKQPAFLSQLLQP